MKAEYKFLAVLLIAGLLFAVGFAAQAVDFSDNGAEEGAKPTAMSAGITFVSADEEVTEPDNDRGG